MRTAKIQKTSGTKTIKPSNIESVTRQLLNVGYNVLSVRKLPNTILYISLSPFGRDVCICQQYASSQPEYLEVKDTNIRIKLEEGSIATNNIIDSFVRLEGNLIECTLRNKLGVFSAIDESNKVDSLRVFPTVELETLFKSTPEVAANMDSVYSMLANRKYNELLKLTDALVIIATIINDTDSEMALACSNLNTLQKHLSTDRNKAYEYVQSIEDCDPNDVINNGKALQQQYKDFYSIVDTCLANTLGKITAILSVLQSPDDLVAAPRAPCPVVKVQSPDDIAVKVQSPDDLAAAPRAPCLVAEVQSPDELVATI